MKPLALLSVLLFLSPDLSGQVKIDTLPTKESLVETFMGEGVSIFNVKVHGNRSSMGYFEAQNSNFPIGEGIVLSTGRVSAIAGQNKSGKTTTSMKEGIGSDPDLSRMVSRQIFNVTVLEFDFIPQYDSLFFDYVFGSEEYPEYVGSPYNDIFCLLIKGPNFPKALNLARVGQPPSTVMINSVNHKKNSNYFIPNYKTVADTTIRYTIEFDGFTTLLTASCRVTRGKLHHIKIAIGNVNDFSYDSGVFLRAGSFGSRGDSEGSRFLLPFDFDARNPNGDHKVLLDSLAKMLKQNPGWKLSVLGHTDSLGGMEYNMRLSEERAGSVASLLIERGVNPKQLFVKGYAYTRPLRENTSEEGREKNRRVELILKRA